jgi:predicted nucleic acid-binding protein
MLLSEDGSYRPLCPVNDEFVAGEIVNRWSYREQARKLKDHHESEMLEFDAVLAELLFRMKQKLSRLGRNGGWSLWLRQQKIQRSTADRLVTQYAESHGLTDDLRHREIIEPLQGNVCLAASRARKRLKNMLKSPNARMNFVKVLADLFGLSVQLEDEGVRLSIPPPVDEDNPADCVVPPVIEVQDDGTIRPVDYELKDEDEEAFLFKS